MRISFLTRLLDLVAPRACAVCGSRLAASERFICSSCVLHLPRTGYHARPQDNIVARLFWGRVTVMKASAFIFFRPKAESAAIVYEMKYRGDVGACRYMGRMMAAELAADGFFDGIDIIVPIPLTRKRRRARGYNQSEELARGVAEVAGLPVDAAVVERKGFSVSQTKLSRGQRMDNVEGTFRLKAPGRIAGRHVLLVDDVITSGATMMSCVRAVSEADGVTVSVLALSFSHG
ncbi:MAG: phosphoribosyltransferase family protein [Prevotella sp.]|jgi:ComF family protein|nr:phosphoribosyltransferase family protein [Prevotella sp. PTAC]MCX4294516.1 phosphoribosyltransferase family protein [Prevotella sp.]NPD55146.1 ComF family protein [Prevotella sp. PTAC]